MTIPRNDEIQTALVAILKSSNLVTGLLTTPDNATGANEIREDQWQGTEFDYPNVRIRMISNNPLSDNLSCSFTDFSVSFMVFSQEASSKEADKLAGIIGILLSGKSFSYSGVSIHLKANNLIPAVRSDRNTWRAECLMQGTASGGIGAIDSFLLPEDDSGYLILG